MPLPDDCDLAKLTEFALLLATAAEKEILPRFRTPSAIDNKLESGFDPVTEADREAEKVMREMIETRLPGDAILGEEFGHKPGTTGFTWILDPIDGTRSFIAGMTSWATLIGLEYEGEPVIGVMHQPYVGETFYGDCNAAWLRHKGTDRQLSVNPAPSLSRAFGTTTSPAYYGTPQRARFLERFTSSIRNIRYDGDAYFFCLLAAGHIDVALDADLQPYDIAPLVPIIKGAGGVVSTWDNGPANGGGNIIAAASKKLHAQTLALLK
ncbi:MAG TPA: inositol monophosphatase family protein [Rhizobiales bacterium]|nr:inositol monophosphatase family protein [Hyphomicrobiales bacterium]